MSKIDLKNFVDINIQQHISKSVNGTRDTVVLFTEDTLASTNEYDEYVLTFNGNTYNTIEVNANSYEKVFVDKPNTLQYLKVYFDNGGINALVICGISISNMTIKDNTKITDDILSYLDNKYIYIAYVSNNENLQNNYNELKNIIKYRNSKESIYGINEKIILASTKVETDIEKVKNFAVKFSSIQGAEMTIAAYFSKTNINKTNSIYDYAFTQEKMTSIVKNKEVNFEGEDITDDKFKTILDNNMNVDIMLAETVRNCGGNNKDGSDLINNFVRIILHQTVTDSLINLLTQKIKNSTGISKIYTVLSQELEKYLNNGYLTTDEIWTDEDLVINGYTIIEKGTALTSGYIIKVLPYNSLTEEEKSNNSVPQIYIILADQYGIRKITINGEII